MRLSPCRGFFHLPAMAFCTLLVLSLTGRAQQGEHPLMREFIGINGHTVQFKPDLYHPVCNLVRDYHPVAWDLAKEPEVLPPFPLAKNKVDWSKVYGSWKEQGWNIDVCLMFESVERPAWKELAKETESYGQAFAKEFGPSGARKLVDSVEIGNEPGAWSDADYSTVFQNMAKGLRAGDPQLKIATCNLTTGKSGKYDKSVSCVEKFTDLFDVLNVHSYAQLEGWPTWKRSFPEDPKLSKYLQDVDALCKWRDAHAPGKPVWLTEFGYDSSTVPPEPKGDFAKWVGVTDEQQAQWLVRSLLVFSATPVDRAYIYFFNDNDTPQVHGSSGITRHFQPKPSYYALSHLQLALGEYRFRRIVSNVPGGLRVQEYQHGRNASQLVWVAWLQSGDGKTQKYRPVNPPGNINDIQRMPMTKNEVTHQATPAPLEIEVGESPVYLFFQAQ